MRVAVAVATAFAVLAGVADGVTNSAFLPIVRLSSRGDDVETRRFYGEATESGTVSVASVPKSVDDAVPLLLRFDVADKYGCSGVDNGLGGDSGALVVRRGQCPFSKKAATAFASGFKAMFVLAEVESLYLNGTGYMSNPCALNCDTAQAADQASCEVHSACGSGLCTQNPREQSGGKRQNVPFCCVQNNLMPMFINDTDILSVFVGFNDAAVVLKAATVGDNYAQVFLEDERINFDGSMIIIFLIGSLVTAFASFRAARSERLKAAWVWSPEREFLVNRRRERNPDQMQQPLEDADQAIDQVELGLHAVAVFIMFCSASLIGLFYLAKKYPQQTVIFIQVLFGLSAIFAVSHFFLRPMVCKVWSGSNTRYFDLPFSQRVRADEITGWLIAFLMVVVWFVCRHASWAWLLLDILGISICCMFLVAVRVPNLKLSCWMLAVFFFYDIFMVFISPVFFGSSVMVDVATAGQGTATAALDNLVCERTRTEHMPMLFLIPRFDNPGNYALLGLGDIFIPGLLVTFACRFDYLKAEASGKRSTFWKVHRYFVPMCIAYSVALLFTLLANMFELNFSSDVKGQPALLYLVPATVGTFSVLAYVRGDLYDLWNYSYDELVAKILIRDEEVGVCDDHAVSTTLSVSMDDEDSSVRCSLNSARVVVADVKDF